VKRSKQPAHRRAKAEAYRLEQRLIRRNEALLLPPSADMTAAAATRKLLQYLHAYNGTPFINLQALAKAFL
jgi:hypothetical protein